MTQVIVYWIGNLGIPGKGPNWMEPYDPNRTIGDLIQSMTLSGSCGERGKRIEIFKHEYGRLDKYDKNNPHWNHNTKLAVYVACMGGINNGLLGSKYVQLAYCLL